MSDEILKAIEYGREIERQISPRLVAYPIMTGVIIGWFLNEAWQFVRYFV